MAGFLYMPNPTHPNAVTSLSYCIVVRCGPNQQSQSLSALQFTQELLAQGHRVIRVFFYQQAVLIASNFTVMPQDEANLSLQWQALAQEHQLELGVCIAGALQNGIVNPQECERYQLSAANLAQGFQLVGLGQLAAASADCDRLISFGA